MPTPASGRSCCDATIADLVDDGLEAVERGSCGGECLGARTATEGRNGGICAGFQCVHLLLHPRHRRIVGLGDVTREHDLHFEHRGGGLSDETHRDDRRSSQAAPVRGPATVLRTSATASAQPLKSRRCAFRFVFSMASGRMSRSMRRSSAEPRVERLEGAELVGELQLVEQRSQSRVTSRCAALVASSASLRRRDSTPRLCLPSLPGSTRRRPWRNEPGDCRAASCASRRPVKHGYIRRASCREQQPTERQQRCRPRAVEAIRMNAHVPSTILSFVARAAIRRKS